MKITTFAAPEDAQTEVVAEQEGAWVRLVVDGSEASLTPDQAKAMGDELREMAKDASTFVE